ncbi:MAG: response regulator, partial [Bacteroidota bacterium]|nr:response regulator [Bacteroidota bacterium]
CIIPAKTNTKTLLNPFNEIFVGEEEVYTGLSLAISSEIIKLLGGSLKIKINNDQVISASFTLTFEKNTSVTNPKFLLKDTPILFEKSILLVSDNHTPCPNITSYASLWGMKIKRTFYESNNFCWIKKTEQHDLLIVDLSNSRLNELETIDKIRKETDKPLVLLKKMKSTNDFFKVIQKNSVILYKPFDALTLFNTYVNIIQNNANKLREIRIQTHLDITQNNLDPSLRILVAENNRTNQKVINRILNKLGYNPTIISNGKKALEELEKAHYDIILMDLQMPIMNGLEATNEIRKRWDKAKQPKIIAITADSLKGDKQTYLDAGLDDYISKPVQMQKLLSVLYKCKPK